jgi:small-conductance mechanosensitive channel
MCIGRLAKPARRLTLREFFEDIDWSRWAELAWTTAARVVFIIVAIYIVVKIVQRIIDPAIRAAVERQLEGEPDLEVEQRIDTLTSVAHNSVRVIALLVGLMTILPEFGFNVGALLAGAGIVGIALGFGAQSLVKDIIGGIFILVENQFTKGDIVSLNGVVGEVEDINMRRTLIRDLDGTVHSIPNGVPEFTSNLTQAYSRVNMQIGVSYSEDLDEVYEVIDGVGRDMAEDPDWKDKFISPPTVLGVDEFGDSAIIIRVLGDTKPLEQWTIMREYRKRLKGAFDTAGIEIPYPHQTQVIAGQKATGGEIPPLVANNTKAS